MTSLSRRKFVLLSTVALLGAACGAPAEAGLRGSGTVLRTREAVEFHAPEAAEADHATADATLDATPHAIPTPSSVHAAADEADEASEPIVASDALPVP